MINNNISSIFKGKVPNIEEQEYDDTEQEYIEKQKQLMNENGKLKILQPINFEDKIMNGRRYKDFMQGKMMSGGNSLDYAEKINNLIGKGGNKMAFDVSMLNNNINKGIDTNEKVNQILGGKSNKTDFESMIKNNRNKNNKDILGTIKFSANKTKIEDYLGFRNKQKTDKKQKEISMQVFSSVSFNDLFKNKNKKNNISSFLPNQSNAFKKKNINKLLMTGVFAKKDMSNFIINRKNKKPKNDIFSRNMTEYNENVEYVSDDINNGNINNSLIYNKQADDLMNEVIGKERRDKFKQDKQAGKKSEIQRINELIDYYRKRAIDAKTATERNKYLKILEQLEKNRRAERKLESEIEEKRNRKNRELQEKKEKTKLGFDKIESSERKLGAELDFNREKIQAQMKLEEAKLKQKTREGERLAFEKELKFGQSVLGSLVGGGRTTPISELVGQKDFSNNINYVTAPQNRGNYQDMRQFTGIGGSGQGYREVIGIGGSGQGYREVIGQPSMSRSFGEIVRESVSNVIQQPQPQQIEEPIQQSQPIQRMEQQSQSIQRMEQQTQPIQRMEQQSQPQQIEETIQQPQPIQIDTSEIDWEKVEPEQIARIDPEYAGYLKRSKGETTYRRGPYKK